MKRTEQMMRYGHRVGVGSICEGEDGFGKMKRSFCHMGELWAEVVLMPLTFCLPFEGSNENRKRSSKSFYQLTFKANVMTLAMAKKVNAVMYKGNLLISSRPLEQDPNTKIYKGIFYDCGQGKTNG